MTDDGNYEGDFAELNMCFAPIMDNISVSKHSSTIGYMDDIAEGVYDVTVTAPTASGNVERSFKLIVGDVTPTATPTVEPTATPTVKPTVEPTATPTVSNKVEFTKDGDKVNAKIILDEQVSAENIKMYVVYKENDVLKRVETVNVNDDLTAEFTIPNELKNAEISVYIWNDKMNPYMDIQQITSLATKCRQLQKSHLAM